MTVAITRLDLSAMALRERAARATDAKVSRRLLAIALVLEGWSRRDAAEACAMDRQTLRDWVHRYNAEGIAGLKTGHGPGRPGSLGDEQMAELKALVLQGPDPAKHGVVRWRCVDLRAEVARRYAVEVNERTIGKWLRKLNLTRLQPRPFHPKKDPAAQAAYKKTSPTW